MFLFSTDIDGTIYDGPESAAAFSRFWQALAAELGSPIVLSYNTGRSNTDTRDLIRDAGLPEPDWLISGVGTEIRDFHRDRPLRRWGEWLSPGWEIEAVRRVVAESTPAEPQPPECQGPFKCSWFWHDAEPEAIHDLEAEVRGAGIDAQAVYSSSRDLDLLPARANKGNAVAFLAEELEMGLDRVVVAGDSGNDSSMYLVDGIRGVVVSNAETTLKKAVAERPVYFAELPCIAGVIEGLMHFRASGVLTAPALELRELQS